MEVRLGRLRAHEREDFNYLDFLLWERQRRVINVYFQCIKIAILLKASTRVQSALPHTHEESSMSAADWFPPTVFHVFIESLTAVNRIWRIRVRP